MSQLGFFEVEFVAKHKQTPRDKFLAEMDKFAGLSLTRRGTPCETTILNFGHLLEEHKWASRFLEEINTMLAQRGLLLKHGTMIDAPFIEVPTSTKNASGKRDPGIH